jgi:fused signal recognition particle receptor
MSWLQRLKNGLAKTANNIASGFTTIVGKKKIDAVMLDEIQDILIAADLGLLVTKILVDKISKVSIQEDVDMETAIKEQLSEEIETIITPYCKKLELDNQKPKTIMLCGVNGNGKTTTAGKLAKLFATQNKKVILAACDTFRASATEQLEIWSSNAGCQIVTGEYKKDPSSVAYQAQSLATNSNSDLLIIDTAGRLQNNQNLMPELVKIVNVLKKVDPEAPHEIIMVLDANTGQNAIQQLETFRKFVPINGIIVTKLDTSTKGGIIVSLIHKYKIPIYAVGVGESAEDLNQLEPKIFARSIFGVANHFQE